MVEADSLRSQSLEIEPVTFTHIHARAEAKDRDTQIRLVGHCVVCFEAKSLGRVGRSWPFHSFGFVWGPAWPGTSTA